MYAVIKTGGKQYKVAANDTITLGKLPGEAGEVIHFPEVLMVGSEAGVAVGAPMVSGAAVTAEILNHKRGRKVISFKKRRRQNSKRRKGHRQDYTVVRIAEILTGGAKSALHAKAPAVDTSNLSLISGIGPTIEKKLIAAGVTTWNQIAAWTEADLAKFDEELKLRGRATREEWIEQAKELLAGKPPRAKIDQAEQKAEG